MSKRHQQLKRQRYYDRCQDCGNLNAMLCQIIDYPIDHIERLCPSCASKAGYCSRCGCFAAGTDGFDFLHQGLCDNCHSEFRAELDNGSEDDGSAGEYGPWDGEDEAWCDTCSNTGTINCHCGGDLWVCYNRGEIPCPNCDRGL